MNTFYPFIHDPKTKKKENEPQPLYIEVGPPLQEVPKQDEEKEESHIIIIEL
jgi:hypothetical protein